MPRLVLALLFVVAVATPAAAQTETIEYYGLDALGSVRLLVDANGQVLERMDYGPFGENLKAAIKMSFEQYAQLARDAETGQDYAQTRNYSPPLGRFNGTDPIFAGLIDPQLWNRYAYTSNNPLRFLDVDGLCQQSVSNRGATAQGSGQGMVMPRGMESCDGSTPPYDPSRALPGSNGLFTPFGEVALDWLTTTISTVIDNATELISGTVGAPGTSGTVTNGHQTTTAGVVIGMAISLGSASKKLPKVLNLFGRAKVGNELYHYTFQESLEFIKKQGLRSGSYATPMSGLSPVHAQLWLSLPRTGYRDAVIVIDVAAMRRDGLPIPDVTRVVPKHGMPGGGYEVRFPYTIGSKYIKWP